MPIWQEGGTDSEQYTRLPALCSISVPCQLYSLVAVSMGDRGGFMLSKQ